MFVGLFVEVASCFWGYGELRSLRGACECPFASQVLAEKEKRMLPYFILSFSANTLSSKLTRIRGGAVGQTVAP
ncbi:MAG: hypothetical protein FWG51_03680, partial [Firmicutes bacterium]|nr:hypothetical protein [Bacillota bacterium]